MRRRELIGSSVAAGVALATGARAAETKAKATAPEYYELRAYRMHQGGQPKIVNDFLGEVYVPLLNKLGVKPVGAFTLTFGPEMPTVFLLLPFPSLAAWSAVEARVAEELPKTMATSPAAKAYLAPPAEKPPYARIERQLLQAFDTFPKLELPAGAAKKEPRIFELRTYETQAELAHAKKMDMFSPRMGELAIFRHVGLAPVLFANTVFGPRQPSFSYMLTFADLAARDAAWKRFRDDPDWQKLRATPGYTDADMMWNITDLVLTPTPYSQI
jgi:hypothetical protein